MSVIISNATRKRLLDESDERRNRPRQADLDLMQLVREYTEAMRARR